MYAVTVVFQIKAEAVEDFLPLMIANAEASLKDEPGCRQFDVCTDPDRPGDVFLYELYDDADAFQAHLQTPHFKSFDAKVARMIAQKTVRTYAKVAS
ncbi:putative quinol monooxygenase [Roseibium aggregatum]|uniref:putative quinol monooxygenase n=1 Tax=Roseibium aggregatum TaxID=187304 RepID=UPI001E4F3B04|nr:putative quinol monooxygenase [Roseibium aggregatum]UES45727.1 antibiotic biosynthesis monooxygenase [Roseibium aggregatum]